MYICMYMHSVHNSSMSASNTLGELIMTVLIMAVHILGVHI